MKKVAATITAGILSFSLFATDFSIDVNPGIVFPSGECKNTLKGPAPGMDLAFNLHLYDIFTVGPELGLDYIIKDGEPSSIVDIAPGVKFGTYMYPFGRLGFGVNAATGVHFAKYDYPGEKNASGDGYRDGRSPGSLSVCNPYVRLEGNVNYRLTYDLAVGLRAGYVVDFFDGHDFDDGFSPFMAGPEVGLGIRYTFSNQKPEQNVEANITQDAPIYPLYMNVYKDAEFGSVLIRNAEGAEIKNVKVFFKAPPYTASNYLCGKVKKIRKGQTASIPLKGDFSSEISKFTDDSSFPGEITVSYDFMGKRMTTTATVLVSSYNRNTMCWVDPNSLAAFINPSDETTIDLAKHAGSIAKSNLRSGFNSKIQTAMYVTELFNSLGFTRVTDKASPYASSHLNISKNDYIQYPFQTISYMSGDSDELGIVLASFFEGAAVKTALIPLENDFVVAVNLEMSSKAVAGIFNDLDQLLFIGEDYYLPISINSISKGFNAAWKSASRQIKAEMDKGDLTCVVLNDAWTVYPPLGMSGKKNVTKPSASALAARASKELDVFTAENMRPKIREYESKVSSGKASDEDKVSLGLLYVRSGDIGSAQVVFKGLAEKGNVSGMNNLANTYILQKDYKSAQKWYEKVLGKDKDNSVAKKGMERIANEK